MSKRIGTNLLALGIVALGSTHLVGPAPASAATEPVCCFSSNSKCCGDECQASASGCEACTGWWDCLWM